MSLGKTAQRTFPVNHIPLNRAQHLPDRAAWIRLLATVLLAGMAVLLALTHWLIHAVPNPAWGYLRAFAEAAMVGGLADWFAVTALFRHPLGLPIPHTAIIPANKDRIASTMAAFLRDNFLIPQVMARRMKAINFAAGVGRFLCQPKTEDQSRLRSGAANLFADILQALDPENLGGLLRSGLKAQLERLDLAPLIGQLLSAAITDGRHLPLLESFIRWAGLTLEANEPLVREIIHDRAHALMRLTGLDAALANAILDGLYRLLAEATVDPDHPLRRKMAEGLDGLAQGLLHDPFLFQCHPPLGVFVRGNPEQHERLHTEVCRRADLFDQGIDAELKVARH